jgi:hypothetical protein
MVELNLLSTIFLYAARYTNQLDVLMNLNRRRYHRVPSRDLPCKLKFRGEMIDIRIVNESIEGLRIGDVKLEHLERGELIEVLIDGETVRGRSRSVSRNKDETYQVGIQREPTILGKRVYSQLLGHFIRFQGQWVFCVLVEQVGSSRVRIRLLDGKEFTISRNQIFQLTEEERRAMLSDPEEFATTVEFYSLMAPHLTFDDIDSLIVREFQKAPIS